MLFGCDVQRESHDGYPQMKCVWGIWENRFMEQTFLRNLLAYLKEALYNIYNFNEV